MNDAWLEPFRSPSVWGVTDCVEFVRSWARNVHGRELPRPVGLVESLSSRTPQQLFGLWEKELHCAGFIRAEPGEVVLVERVHMLCVAVWVDPEYILRIPQGIRPARGYIRRGYILRPENTEPIR